MSYNRGAVQKPVFSSANRLELLQEKALISVDAPSDFVSRITLNRPEKRNAMNHAMRAQIFEQLQTNDQDPNVRVTVIRGAGSSFCAGYDLDMDKSKPFPMFEAEGEGSFQRNVLAGWQMIMDLGKPVIAQVHGHCLAGGSELASACDVICVADDCKIGYPPVRSMGLPDMQIFPWVMNFRQSMLTMLTGDSMNGVEAVQKGWATLSFASCDLERETLRLAERILMIPSDLQQFNKRSVHRAMEAKGMRTYLRSATDLQCVSFNTDSSKSFMAKFDGKSGSAAKAFKERDQKFSRL